MYNKPIVNNPCVIRWRGASDEKKSYIAVFIKGKRYVFSRQGDGWCCEVDFDDPDIQEAIRQPYSQIEVSDPGAGNRSLEDLLLDTDTDDVLSIIDATTNVQWLTESYVELVRMKQSKLAAQVSERLKALGVGTDGLPLGRKPDGTVVAETPPDEQKNEEAPGVPTEEPETAGEDTGDAEEDQLLK